MILNFAGALLRYAVEALNEMFVYGMNIWWEDRYNSFFYKLSPVYCVGVGGFRIWPAYIAQSVDGQYWFSFDGKAISYILALAGAGIVLSVLALLLFRRREMERSGDVIAVKPLRPVFLYCFSLGFAIVFAWFVSSMQSYNLYGAETEGMPNYIFFDEATRHPLGRPRPDRELKKNSFVQLGLSASIDGYCGSIGVPVSMGQFTPEQRKLVEFGRLVHNWTKEHTRAGLHMSEIDKAYYDLFVDSGMKEHYVYDPLHGLGLAEVESYRPKNDDPDYIILPEYTFQTDNFLLAGTFGFRFETGICVHEDGIEEFGKALGELYELGF